MTTKRFPITPNTLFEGRTETIALVYDEHGGQQGDIVDNVKDLPRTFKEAQVALEVGKVFDTEKSIINYENLGIGRLIYQLPIPLCKRQIDGVGVGTDKGIVLGNGKEKMLLPLLL